MVPSVTIVNETILGQKCYIIVICIPIGNIGVLTVDGKPLLIKMVNQ